MPSKDAIPASTERELYAHFLKLLGQRIRTLRKARGWTLRHMVIEYGYHLSKWQGFESGRFGMSIPSLLRVAKTLDMHPSELIAGIEVSPAAAEPVKVPAKAPHKAAQTRASLPKRS